MTVFLDRVNSVPIINDDFSYEFKQWCSNTVDTLNEVINDLQSNIVSREIISSTISSVSAVVNTLYIPTNNILTQFQLPQTTSDDVGAIIQIAGQGNGGWKLLNFAGQTIQIRDVGAVANTSITSSNRYDSISIILVEASTWITLSTQTTGFVIV